MIRAEPRRHAERLLRGLVATGGLYAGIRLLGYFAHLGNTERHHVESALLIVGVLATGLLVTLRRESRTEPPAPARWAWTLPAFVALSLALYGRALSVGYLSDDYVLAERAWQGQFLAATHEFVRPVPLIAWRAIFAGGGGPGALHLLNVLLHGLNGALTAMLARRLGLRAGSAALAGVIFVVWPTQVEAVSWAAGIFDVLMTSLVLLAVYLYTSAARLGTAPGLLGMTGLTVLALLSKETALALPVLLIVVSISRWELRRPTRAELAMMVTVAVTCCAYFIWRTLLRSSVVPFAWPEITRYTLKEQVSRSFGSLAVPLSAETIERAPWLAIGLALLAVGPALWALAASRQRHDDHSIAVQGLLWALAAGLPAVGYLFVGNHMLGSRYVYLAAAGWAIYLAATAQLWTSGFKWKRAARLVMAMALVAMVLPQTVTLLSEWRAAAAFRDTLLAEADRAAANAGCVPHRVVGVPETLRGAHVFENGFLEALASVGPQARSRLPGTVPKPCSLRWSQSVFVAEFP